MRRGAAVVALVLASCAQPPTPGPAVAAADLPTTTMHLVDVEPRRAPAAAPARPSRSRSRTVTTWPQTHVVRIVRAAAVRYGLDVDRFLRMIRCESGFNPRAVGGGGLYLGLGQHHRDYWPGRARAAGYPGGDWANPVVNANVTAWLVTKAGWGPWPVCGR